MARLTPSNVSQSGDAHMGRCLLAEYKNAARARLPNDVAQMIVYAMVEDHGGVDGGWKRGRRKR